MILVTGATGFVGRALVDRLARDGLAVRAGVRRGGVAVARGVQAVCVGDLSAQTDWSSALAGVDAVVHTAARVHVMQDAATDPLAEYRRVNVQGTLHLARQAAAAGVRRFVFLSSITMTLKSTSGRPLRRLATSFWLRHDGRFAWNNWGQIPINPLAEYRLTDCVV